MLITYHRKFSKREGRVPRAADIRVLRLTAPSGSYPVKNKLAYKKRWSKMIPVSSVTSH